jgi:5-methylcytosine-specific restriction protein B
MSDSQIIIPFRRDVLVRQVGREFIDEGLGAGMSVFTPKRPIWSEETVGELYRLYNYQLDTGPDTFIVKLKRQLASGSDNALQLAAELLTLQGLPLVNLTAVGLRSRVDSVLSWMREPVTIPAQVSAAFEQGTWNGGIGAHTMLWKWLIDAVGFLQAWWQLPADRRKGGLADPWAWRSLLHEHKMVPSLREELLYLAFPTHFLPIVSLAQKKAIRAAFAETPDENTGSIDQDLLRITVRIQSKTDGPVDYYLPPFLEHWQDGERSRGKRRAWLVRPDGGRDRLERWLRDSFVSLGAVRLGEVAPGSSRSQVRAAVETGYQHLDYAQRIARANEFHAFLSQMDSDDIVATVVDDQLYLGVLADAPDTQPEWTAGELHRPAEWATAPISANTLPAALSADLDQQGTVVDLTGALPDLVKLSMSLADSEGSAGRSRRSLPFQSAPTLAGATDELADRLHMGQTWLGELIELWQARSQIVLYGPPGTGKTFLARALAGHVADRDAVRLVQFHPSYAYEDFFEGFRPAESLEGGPVGFVKTPGPLREIAAQARDDPERPYVLVIDEINRANLAKVFGELYFLLEYREATVRLQYSPSEAFNLPPNVFIIGTMNTADRSIALVDAAVRRRFAFIELHPDEQPVRDVLGRWLAKESRDGDERAALLEALNALIGEQDHDFKIGPSYLMRQGLENEEALARVWRHDLLPLLEEHYYGRLTRAQVHGQFGLAAVRAGIDSGASSDGSAKR